jgi:PadR family transcriptional regulator PadR
MGLSPKNASFMNGVPELLILAELARGEMYGYQLVRAVQARTGNAISLSEGCVYPLVHSLERKGWLTSRQMTAAGRNRVYYRLTPKGKRRLDSLTSRWGLLTQAISSALTRTV